MAGASVMFWHHEVQPMTQYGAACYVLRRDRFSYLRHEVQPMIKYGTACYVLCRDRFSYLRREPMYKY